MTVPMPPSTIIHVPSEPGRRHMLWTRKFIPVPGVSQVPVSPEKPSVTAYIARDEIALEAEAVEVLADRLAAQIDEGLAQRGPHVALGGLLDRERLLEPGGRDVVAELARSRRLQRLVGAPVGLGEEARRTARFIAAWSEPKSR